MSDVSPPEEDAPTTRRSDLARDTTRRRVPDPAAGAAGAGTVGDNVVGASAPPSADRASATDAATASAGSSRRDSADSASRSSATRSTRRGDRSSSRSGLLTRSRPELPTITLPRVVIPSIVTETGAKVINLTGTRIKPLAEATAPAWRPVLDVLRWICSLGWAVLGLGLLAWWLGTKYHWTELLMIAAGCLVLFLACVALAVGRSKVEIHTDVDPTRVTVGDAATGRIEVRNLGKRGMLPLLVELPVGRTAARFTLPTLSAGASHEELFVVPTERRGVIQVGPATTVHGDPLGLVRRVVEWTEQTELFVHPRTVPLESLGAGLLRDLEGEVTPELSMADLAFHALREYQPGDDRRYIHWRSTAKHGRLLVRQFLDTRRSHLVAVVDTTPTVYTGEEDAVELAISCAASLAVRSILDEQDTTVVCNDQAVSRTTARLTLDAFSRAEVGPVDIFAAAGNAVALAPDASLAVLVTGAHRPFIQIQRALGQFEVEVIKVAIIVDPDEGVGVRRVGDVTMLSVRELADLRRVLFAGVLA